MLIYFITILIEILPSARDAARPRATQTLRSYGLQRTHSACPVPNTDGVTDMDGVQGMNLRNKMPAVGEWSPVRKMKGDDDDE